MNGACLLAALLLSRSLVAAAADESEDIRILVAEGVGGLSIRGAGLRVSDSGESFEVRGRSLRVDCRDGAAVVPGLAPGEGPVAVEAVGSLFAAGRELRGSIEVRCTGDRWMAINVLPLEAYLDAVLGAEMPPSFPPEALKAQAVAARSYALHRKIDAWAKGLPYHLGATVLSQVYGGVAAEDPRAKRAVDATRGEVLAYGMLPVEAYFHSACGGRTETGAAALGRDLPYLASVPCPCAAHAPHARWSVRVTEGELLRLAGALWGRSRVRDLAVSARTSTGRARTLRVTTRAGVRTVPAAELRSALGWLRLPSLWFDVRRRGDTFVFAGRGSGHGAGLCQWGARVLAEQGRGYREILAHYYPGTEVRRAY